MPLSHRFGARVILVPKSRHALGVRVGRLTVIVLSAFGFLLCVSAFPALADPVPFASTSGSCSPTNSYSEFVVSTGAHPFVLARLQTTGGAGILSWSQPADFEGADTMWVVWGSVSTGTSGTVICQYPGTPPFSYSISFFDFPSLPVSFSGASTPGGSVDPYRPGSTSEVAFTTRATEHYVADLALSQGTAALAHDDVATAQTFASSGTYDLGLLPAGQHTLSVIAKGGPQAKWQLGIRALPVTIPSFTLSQPFTRPGRLVTATYTVSGDTAISASVVNGSGVAVRSLGEGFPATHGQHTLTWDALDSAGKPVPNGQYDLVLKSADPYGNTTSAKRAVTVDTQPPTVTFQFGSTISPMSGVVFAITDRLSGFRKGWVTIDGRSSGFHVARAGTSRFIVTAPGGWSRGKHLVTVTAQDAVGNQARTSRNFLVR